ncbi:sigma-54 dependent transcriptional regulator [Pseudomonas sp. MMS21-TM103]|nr:MULTISPECIES: sigma-54 dependent transcriptional regulator [unclassified Pseudomonas]MCG4452761.1 sigma-54 dependent transcriptional regulator [Pseudomonas sp. MMS21 TM103]
MPATAQQLLDEPRRALLFDLSNDERFSSNLHVTDWVFDRITSSSNNLALLKQRPYSVGVAFLPSSLSEDQREQVETLLNTDENLSWVALTNPANLENPEFRQLIYEHFYDYFSLPLNDSAHLRCALGHLHGMSKLRHTEDHLLQPIEEFHMVGSSKQFLGIFDQIRRVATVDAPVLIRGETGVGKEMIARAVHQRSRNRGGPFVAVNCGALPETLIHAELFGYEKGAFTGAYKRKIGRIEAAQNGTIFLDEIGDLPQQLQVYLLRFLEQKTIERLGGNQSLTSNARVIAATHVNLEQAVSEGRFREDLYYRLNVLSIEVPRLAQRNSDIELLARFFLHKFAKEQGSVVRGFTRQAVAAMQSYDWPGNVRELINRIRRALVMSENRMITPRDLGLAEIDTRVEIEPLEQVRAHAEEVAVRSCLSQSMNNVSHAAKLLGVSRVTLYRMMDKYGIR